MRHTTSKEVSDSRPKRVLARPNYTEVPEDDVFADTTQESSLQPAQKRVRMAKSRKNETSTDEVSLLQQPPLSSSRVNASGSDSKRVVSADTEVLEQPSEPRRSSRISSKRSYRDELPDEEEQVPSVQSGRKKLSAKAQGKQKVVEDQDYVNDGEVVDDEESDFEFDYDDTLKELAEEFNPGPDVEGTALDVEEDEEKVWVPIVYPIPDIDLEADEVIRRFSDLTRRTINLFQEEALWWSDRIFEMPAHERPMTLPIWRVLTKAKIEDRVKFFCAYTPRETQEVTIQKVWSKEDWLSLPDDPEDFDCPGNYGNFATGNIRYANSMKADAYAGSTICLRKRKKEHTAIIDKHIPESLPEVHQNSRHYNQACRDGVESDFKVFNTFFEGIDSAWLIIYEGIWQLWLHSMQNVTTYTVWRSIACVETYERVRSKLALPEVTWTGMNAAWTLQQGFRNPAAGFKSPCKNSACGVMTLPSGVRILFDGSDPMGGFICHNCYHGLRFDGVLPDEVKVAETAARIEKRKMNKDLRAQVGSDPGCSGCEVPESELIPVKNRKTIFYPKMSSAEIYPGQLFCPACLAKVLAGVSMPLSEEEARLQKLHHFKSVALACGWELACDHCQDTDMDTRHTVLRDDGMYLCSSCNRQSKYSGQLPNLAHATETRLRKISDPINKAAVEQLREQDLDVPCVYDSCFYVSNNIKANQISYTSIGAMHDQCARRWRSDNGIVMGKKKQ